MNTLKPTSFIVILLILNGCTQRFPMEKRYWDADDYRNVIGEIEYKTPEDEEYPRFSNPETADVIRKLVDAENYRVILDDPELGLKFKSEVGSDFFQYYQNLSDVYRVMDRQDKFIYSEELIAIEKFGLGLQIRYFKLGNDLILQDSPTSDIVKTNERTIISNFNLYLDYVSKEKNFISGFSSLSEGITTHFVNLIDTFPNADYSSIASKAARLIDKTTDVEMKSALTTLLAKIESVKKTNEVTE
jgi:hypothetical protein